MTDAACQTSYLKMWKIFSNKLTNEEKQRRKELNLTYNIHKDAFSNRYPDVVVSIDYSHPILSALDVDECWCGANEEEDVYNNPYAASSFKWEVELKAWNRFQKKCKSMTEDELDNLQTKRDQKIANLEQEWDSRPKRSRLSY